MHAGERGEAMGSRAEATALAVEIEGVDGGLAGGEASEPKIDLDTQLMLDACAGDESAFPTLFRRHHARVLNYCLRMVGNLDRAEELAQETFLNVYRARRRYEPRAHFVTYLFRVATNLCLNEKRRLARWGRPAEVDAPDAKELVDVDRESIEERIAAVEHWERLRRAVEQLPKRQAAALLATRLEGLSQNEAAAALGVSIQALKSLLFRATRTLRRELGPHLDLVVEPEEAVAKRPRKAAVELAASRNRLPI